jgi:uncharacterized protein YndB with AHSA1/START domain
MKMTSDIEIDAGPASVWAAFENPDNLERWRPSFRREKQLAGKHGEVGSVSRLRYTENGRSVVVIENVTERREPFFLAATYESPKHTSLVVNHFEALDGGRTRWVAYTNLRFHGLARLFGPFSRESMLQRLRDDMQRFKLMVETDLAGEDA